MFIESCSLLVLGADVASVAERIRLDFGYPSLYWFWLFLNPILAKIFFSKGGGTAGLTELLKSA
jgi:hypothetical protein